eukprot:1443817-Pleurochrysis_carterae.AAC.1
MSTVNMLGTLVMLGVVGQVDGRLVVHGERRRARTRVAQIGEERAQVHGLFGCFAGGDDLGLARRQRNSGLLL